MRRGRMPPGTLSHAAMTLVLLVAWPLLFPGLSAKTQTSQISIPLSLHSVCIPRTRRGLCPLGSFDLLYLFVSFLFFELEYSTQVTEICSAKGFYRKLQMTHTKAKSSLFLKLRLSAIPCPSIHPSAPSCGWKHLLMLRCPQTQAGAGPRDGQAWTFPRPAHRTAGQGEKDQGQK